MISRTFYCTATLRRARSTAQGQRRRTRSGTCLASPTPRGLGPTKTGGWPASSGAGRGPAPRDGPISFTETFDGDALGTGHSCSAHRSIHVRRSLLFLVGGSTTCVGNFPK